MPKSLAVLSLALVTLGAAAAGAQERPARFTMTPTEGGFVRLDTETGAVSICTRKEGQWACELLPESQQALSRKLERLEAENKRLEAELGRSRGPNLAAPGPQAPPPVPPELQEPPAPKESFSLPTEQDIDKAFDYLESVIRKFRDRMKRLEDSEKPATPL